MNLFNKSALALTGILWMLSTPTFAQQNDCLVTRASFDIGSGKTSMKVARVDQCLQKILNFRKKEVVKIGFNNDLKQSLDGTFSQTIIDQAITEFKRLTTLAKSEGATEIHGVATEAIRKAKNGDVLISRALEEASLPIEIISQDEEAQIGFVSAVSTAGSDPGKIIVWDIGSGSLQISTRVDGQIINYNSLVASRSARDFVMTEVKDLDPLRDQTPNPIGLENIQPSLTVLQKHIEPMSSEISEKLLRDDTQVIGIGPLFGLSILPQTGQQTVTLNMLNETLKKRASLNDSEIGGKYADTEVSNLLLVSAFMKKFEIKSVSILDVDLNEGELVNPRYWRSSDSF